MPDQESLAGVALVGEVLYPARRAAALPLLLRERAGCAPVRMEPPHVESESDVSTSC